MTRPPPIATAAGAPASSATAPASMPPTGMRLQVRLQTPITRARYSSGSRICSIVLTDTMYRLLATAPIASNTAESQKFCEKANPINTRPKTVAPMTDRTPRFPV